MLRAMNYLLHAVHVGLMLFTMTGWIYPPLRVAHLIACCLTLGSWFIIGLAIGKPGFCLVTEVQFWVRKRLGIQQERGSYVVYLIERLTGRAPCPKCTDMGTQAALYALTALSAVLVAAC